MEKQDLNNKISIAAYKDDLAAKAERLQEVFAALLDKQASVPQRLKDAMEYTLLSPGKRIRGALVAWTCQMLCGRVNHEAEIAGAAVEMIHTYSLIHDDLPAMDDDDLRRGRPSCHKQFDEATAILAGDALLTLAFEILSVEIPHPQTAVRMIRMLSKAAGPEGLIAGQMADMQAENTKGTLKNLQYIHINKTARMFAASTGMGAIAGGADENQMDCLLKYGLKIGLGFQITDDLLDVSASSEQVGKTAGKDTKQGKLTYPSLIGADESRTAAEKLAEQATAALDCFGSEADILRLLAEDLLNRKR